MGGVGRSAGGGLAAGVAAMAGRASPPIAGLVLLSPWLDLTVTSAGYAANSATDPLFSAESASMAVTEYLQGHASDDPLASLLWGPVADFPPTYVNVATGMVLADDTWRMHGHLREAGVSSSLNVVDGMEHVAVMRNLTLPGSAETFDTLCALIDGVPA